MCIKKSTQGLSFVGIQSVQGETDSQNLGTETKSNIVIKDENESQFYFTTRAAMKTEGKAKTLSINFDAIISLEKNDVSCGKSTEI